MNTKDSFFCSSYADEMHMEERELSAFVSAVTELYGPEQARLSEKDWLDESELVDPALNPRVEIGGLSRLRPRLDWQIACRSL